MIFSFEFATALLLLINKFYLLKKNPVGWIFGIAGSICMIVYFNLLMFEQMKDLSILVVNGIAMLILMFYGCLIAYSKKPNYKKVLEKYGYIFKVTVVSITITVCLLLLIGALNEHLIFIQFFSVSFALIGTLLMAIGTKKTLPVGWFLYIVTHILSIYFMLSLGAWLIIANQTISLCIAILGLKNEIRKSKK